MRQTPLVLTLLLLSQLACGAEPADNAGNAPLDIPKDVLRARNPSLKLTWLKPEKSLAPFTQIMLPPTEFSYRDVKPLYGPDGTSQSRSEFPISQSNRDTLTKNVNEVFRDELGEGRHYHISTEPGPGVLIIRTSLLDIVSHVPPEPVGRSAVYVDSVGDATLLVELVDSTTGETLARAADRRTAEPALGLGRSGFGNVRAEAPSVWAEVRQLAHSWGRAIGSCIDQVYFEAKPK